MDKIPTKLSESLVIGSCVHDAVEDIVSRKSLGMDMPEDTAVFASQIVSKRFEADKGISDALEYETVRNEVLRIIEAPLILSGIDLIKAKLDNDGQPIIERKVELQVPDVDVPVIGYIDIILSDGTPADFKTATRSWTQEKAQTELQPVFYLGAMNQCGMEMNWRFKHIVMVRNKSPKFQMFEHEHKPIEVFRLFEQIQTVWKSINQGVFLPAAPGCWKCSPKACDFWDICQNS